MKKLTQQPTKQLTKQLSNHHPVRLCAPYYSGQSKTHRGGQAELHRYFEPEFVPRFQRDLQRHSINATSLNTWKKEDAFSRYDHTTPVLRLPMHKSFYLVSCEVVCDRLGLPALDPQKIKSAGFVIRRHTSHGEQSWMLIDDEVQGWEATPSGERDPDVNRRLCCNTLRNHIGNHIGNRIGNRIGNQQNAPQNQPIATYTGELTHPLHALKTYDAAGKCHTILHGYLPLGGTYNVRQKQAKQVFDAQSLADFQRITAAQLPWPFGFLPPAPNRAVDKTWQPEHTRPVDNGRPSAGFFELLKVLVNRYHLGESALSDNARLAQWASQHYFYDEAFNLKLSVNHRFSLSLSPANFSDSNRASFKDAQQYSLQEWLTSLFNPDSSQPNSNRLIEYLALQEKNRDAQGAAYIFDALPARKSGNLHLSFYLTAADTQELRTLLDQRVLEQAVNKACEIPLPKFTQGKDDLYQAIPFVRIEDACGHEHIVWADAHARTELFRVAAPFDPNASRPSVIQMPSLSDLKGGLAKGVSLITPPDTFGLLDALNLKKGVSEDVLPSSVPNAVGIQWICSFSLPVISLVAMILLMITISLLNIIFFWMPFVRICLPFPTIKKP